MGPTAGAQSLRTVANGEDYLLRGQLLEHRSLQARGPEAETPRGRGFVIRCSFETSVELVISLRIIQYVLHSNDVPGPHRWSASHYELLLMMKTIFSAVNCCEHRSLQARNPEAETRRGRGFVIRCSI